MDRAAAVEMLPEPYALALRLQEAGATDHVIARGLEIEPEAVGPLLRLATAKLDELLRRPEPAGAPIPPPAGDGVTGHGAGFARSLDREAAPHASKPRGEQRQ